MFDLVGEQNRNCAGTTRRTFLRAGALGLGGLTLADLLRAKAFAGETHPRSRIEDLSVILVWLDGGPPQHETYDPKPDAPSEYRGPYQTIPTNAPGVYVSEHLGYHARHMDKMTLIRSVFHNNGDHFAAAHWMLTGFLGSNAVNLAAQYPSAGSIISKLKGARKPGVPAYVGLPHTHSVGLSPGYHGAAYLGVAYNPFSARGRPEQDRLHRPQPRPSPSDERRASRGSSRTHERVRQCPPRRRFLGPDGRPRSVLQRSL